MHKPNPIVSELGHDPHSSPQPGTPIPDWITLHPKITHTAYRLYAIMRFRFLSDHTGEPLQLTYEELASLLPGPNGKPSSVSTIKSALRVLTEVGLLVNPDGGRIVTSQGHGSIQTKRRYQLNEFPTAVEKNHKTTTDNPSIVYLIGAPGSSMAKIGVTRNLPNRLETLQRASAHRLEVLWSTSGGKDLEGWLHRQFHHLRTHSEWFDFGHRNPAQTVAAKAAEFVQGVSK